MWQSAFPPASSPFRFVGTETSGNQVSGKSRTDGPVLHWERQYPAPFSTSLFENKEGNTLPLRQHIDSQMKWTSLNPSGLPLSSTGLASVSKIINPHVQWLSFSPADLLALFPVHSAEGAVAVEVPVMWCPDCWSHVATCVSADTTRLSYSYSSG